MRRISSLAVVCLVAALVPLLPAPADAVAVVHHVTLSGQGVSTYPAYSPGISRYGISTTNSTSGTVTVAATTSDPQGVVTVDGRPVKGSTTLHGLTSGDEVAVQIRDRSGTSNQSYVYLPTGFPVPTATSAGAGPTPGSVFLTLVSPYGGPKFETVVDRHGVPSWVHESLNPEDLKLQPDGSYTVARGRTNDLYAYFDIVELDQRFHEVATRTTQGLANTEFHDSILLPGGGQILMAYEPNSSTGRTDSIVQELRPDHSVALTWNSADHTVPSDGLTGFPDYAHLNSMDVMHDGNLLLSFRHLSQVMKVDRSTGAVIWRLGGKRSDFTFPDDPYGGPCAQHTARELANGDVMVWDNGSQVTPTTLQPMCPEPSNPTGPRVTRAFSRVAEYHLDESTHQAHLVWEQRTGEFSEFAGSAQRLGSRTGADNTLIGTANGLDTTTGADAPDVYEVTPAHQVVWSLSFPGYYSYRAFKAPAPDRTDPLMSFSGPKNGAVYREGTRLPVRYSCTDTGGSSLQECRGTVPSGSYASTAPGHHVLSFSARDGDGNAVTRRVAYSVPTSWQPDAIVRRRAGANHGANVYHDLERESVTVAARTRRPKLAVVTLQNDGTTTDALRVGGTGSGPRFKVRYLHGRTDVTWAVEHGRLSTGRLAPGRSYVLTVSMSRRGAYHRHHGRTFVVRAVSAGRSSRYDAVAVTRR